MNQLSELRRAAERQGWRVVHGKRSGHLKWYSPLGVLVAVSASTPGDRRTVCNTRAQLRRAGLDV